MVHRCTAQLETQFGINSFIDVINSVVNDYINQDKSFACRVLLNTDRYLNTTYTSTSPQRLITSNAAITMSYCRVPEKNLVSAAKAF